LSSRVTAGRLIRILILLLLQSPIMTKPLTFSVGIPAYNQGEFLEETILSLLNQTRPPDEIVISDHYSTDNTPEIIEKFAGHVRGVKPPPGCNVSGQWNFTLSQSVGGLVHSAQQ
jgi:cellulose synthase/poly-beta-1,6-N-acetylglucosamine synthase-like glycosyltransferase